MARLMMDIQCGDDYDLEFAGGDFGIVESTAAHQVSLILDGPGDYKQDPETGVGVLNYLDSEKPEQLLNELSKQFTGDGMDVRNVALLPSGNIEVDAVYK